MIFHFYFAMTVDILRNNPQGFILCGCMSWTNRVTKKPKIVWFGVDLKLYYFRFDFAVDLTFTVWRSAMCAVLLLDPSHIFHPIPSELINFAGYQHSHGLIPRSTSVRFRVRHLLLQSTLQRENKSCINIAFYLCSS